MIFTEEEVIFYDTDSGGVISNIAYLRYVEKARCRLFGSLGMELTSMTESGVYPTVVRTEIDYKQGGRLGDRLKVEAEIDSIEKLRIVCKFRITREVDQTILSEAVQTIVLLKLPEGKPVRPPNEWNKSIQ
ncbi:MAG: thioesterase family protein [Verrucomicrobiales bacterium]|nr:thioesterase family protein [Verrucomicrobiales bacterium]